MKRTFVLETVRNLGVGLAMGSLIAPVAKSLNEDDIVYVVSVLTAGLILITLSIILYREGKDE